MSAKLRAQEINYINHMGAWREESTLLGQIASATYIISRETITPHSITLLENYIYWARKRAWPGEDDMFFFNYAVTRLKRIKQIQDKRKANGEDLEKIITIFIK